MTDTEIVEEITRITEDMHSLVFSLNLIRREVTCRTNRE